MVFTQANSMVVIVKLYVLCISDNKDEYGTLIAPIGLLLITLPSQASVCNRHEHPLRWSRLENILPLRCSLYPFRIKR